MGKLILKRIALSLCYIIVLVSLNVGFMSLINLSPWFWFTFIIYVPVLFVDTVLFFGLDDELNEQMKAVRSTKEPPVHSNEASFTFKDGYGQECRLEQGIFNPKDTWLFLDKPRKDFENSILLTRENIRQINDFIEFLDKNDISIIPQEKIEPKQNK